jgi:hypothetical protein
MASNREIAEWLREAAQFHLNVMDVSIIDCVTDRHSTLARLFSKRANLVESMRCETCRWWLVGPFSGRRCSNVNTPVENCKLDFSCYHWEEKECTE